MSDIDHFEALFNRKYLRWFHLNNSPALIEIIRVNRDVDMVLPGGKRVQKPTIDFKVVKGKLKEMKPLVLIPTTAKQIVEIYGDKPSGWIGKQIVLFLDRTEITDRETKRRKMADCIRVRAPKTVKKSDATE